MALPATGYDLATVTNPGGALTDFTLLVDLSRMSATFDSNWNTSSQGYGRAAIDGGTPTEVACDWIDLNHTAKTGWLRVKWAGTLAASGTQKLRVYPPNTANSQYAVSDTYGQYNAYDSNTQAFWPMEDVNNRKAANSLTEQNSASVGGTTGQVGSGTDLETSSSHYCDTGITPSASAGTYMAWITIESSTAGGLFALAHYFGGNRIYLASRDQGAGLLITGGLGDSQYLLTTSSKTADAWYHAALTWDGSNGRLYIDGALDQGPTAYSNLSSTGDVLKVGAVYVASPSGYYDGKVDEVSVHNAARSLDWIKQEYDQTNDQATFWGTWAWQSASSVAPLASGHLAKMMN